MTYYVTPPNDGTYRVRLYASSSAISGNNYWEFSPGNNSGVALKPLDTNSAFQKWKFSKNNNGTFNISSLGDGSGLTMYKTANTYWGHGYPLGGSPSGWTIQPRTIGSDTFAKIFCSGNSEPLDSYYGEWVHFYTDSNQNAQPRQRWVFEPVQDSPPPYKSNNNGNKQPVKPNSGGISTDPSLSIMDDSGNQISAADNNVDPGRIYIINNSSGMVKVHITDVSGTGDKKELNDFILQVGEYYSWQRRLAETLSVYRTTDASGNFSPSPTTYSVSPGRITAIV